MRDEESKKKKEKRKIIARLSLTWPTNRTVLQCFAELWSILTLSLSSSLVMRVGKCVLGEALDLQGMCFACIFSPLSMHNKTDVLVVWHFRKFLTFGITKDSELVITVWT